MFYGLHAVAAWVVAIWAIDWRRIRQLFVFGLWGHLLCDLQDNLGAVFGLWEYRDSGLFNTHIRASFIVGLSAAPLMGIFFAQGLKPGRPFPWGRMLLVTALSLLPEATALLTDHIRYHFWWNIGWSALAYGPVWLSFWGLHRWLFRAADQALPR